MRVRSLARAEHHASHRAPPPILLVVVVGSMSAQTAACTEIDPERANYPSPWHAVARRTERARALDPTAKSTNRQTARHQLMHNALYARARVPSLNAPTVSPRLTPSPNLSRSVFPSLPGRPRRFEEFSNCIILKLLLKGVQGEK